MDQSKQMENQVIFDFEEEKKKIDEEYKKKVNQLNQEFEDAKKKHPKEIEQKVKDDKEL